MAVQPVNIPVKMTAGVDEKSDPKSLQSKLTILQNASFQSPGQYQKRDGFKALTPIGTGVSLSTFKNELLSSDGNSFYSYSPETSTQINKGPFTPVQLSTTNVSSQVYDILSTDQAYDPTTGLKCYIYIVQSYQSFPYQLFYSIVDTKTQTNIVYNKLVTSTSSLASAKVGLVGNSFVITYIQTSTSGIYFNSINTATPSVISGQTLVSNNVYAFFRSIDMLQANGNLYFAYPTSSGCSIFYINSSLAVSSVVPLTSALQPSGIALATDTSGNIWIAKTLVPTPSTSFYNNLTILNSTLTTTVLASTDFDSSTYLSNVTMNVQGTTATIYAEATYYNQTFVVTNFSNYIKVYKVTITGTVTAGVTFATGVGLASKCFNYNGQNFMLTVYDGSYQPQAVNASGAITYKPVSIEPTYFLINASAHIVMKLAPSLAFSYLNIDTSNNYFPLPEVNKLSTGIYSFSYLIEENSVPVQGVVTYQFGAKDATINMNQGVPPPKIEIGNNLQLASGQMWAYDGQNIVEQGFHIFPENVELESIVHNTTGGIGIGASTSSLNQVQYSAIYEWNDNQGQIHRSAPSVPLTVTLPANGSLTPRSITVSFSAGSNIATAAVPVAGFFLGQTITDSTTPTAFPAGTFITGLYTSGGFLQLELSQPAATTASADVLQTFDTGTINIYVPTLRQTNKANVSLVLYRTTNNGTIFYRVTAASVANPSAFNRLAINDPTVDFLTITDTLPDAQIIGNEQLYTTGNVVENINPPAVSALATFKNRVIALMPENPFQWIYSQQIQNGVPVEFNSEEFIENIDQEIGQALAVKQLDDKLILFGPSSKYYVVGQGPTPSGLNDDFSDATKIAGVSGCSNPISVVEVPTGLIYQDAVKGFYFLDRNLAEQYIGADIESFNGQTITAVQKFETQNKVMFTFASGSNAIYDWFVGQWEVDPTPTEIADAVIFKNLVTYIQPNGAILQQTPGTFSDNGVVIPMQLQTGWIEPAGLEGFLRLWEFQILGTYKSPHTLTVTFYNDFNLTTPTQVVTIPVLSDPGLYQFRIKIKQQKCESVLVNITESQSGSPGEGFALSSLAFRVAVKKGLNKLPAGASY